MATNLCLASTQRDREAKTQSHLNGKSLSASRTLNKSECSAWLLFFPCSRAVRFSDSLWNPQFLRISSCSGVSTVQITGELPMVSGCNAKAVFACRKEPSGNCLCHVRHIAQLSLVRRGFVSGKGSAVHGTLHGIPQSAAGARIIALYPSSMVTMGRRLTGLMHTHLHFLLM